MRKWFFLSLVVAGCGFSGGKDTPDAGTQDGPVDSSTPPLTARRIPFTIAAGKVTADLDNFPVFVELRDVADLMTKLDTSRNLSFRQRSGDTLTSLPFELQAYDPATGTLLAWVRLPKIAAAAGASFELLYGRAEVKVAEDRNAVWAGEYLSVFHFDAAVGGTNSIVNSANNAQHGTPSGNLNEGDRKAAKLGTGLDFDGGSEVVTFPNPLSGNGPSTFSAWIKQRDTSDNDIVLQLGVNMQNQARVLYSRLDNTAQAVGSTLSGDQHLTSTSIENSTAGWNLVHWVYNAQNGATYVDGALAANGTIMYNAAAATTAGGMASIGNAAAEFGANSGAKAELDEVRISAKPRPLAWIAAEYANQSNPALFLTIGAAEDTQVRL